MHRGKLTLYLTVNRALEAHQQLLIEHGSDPLQRRQLRDVCALPMPKDGPVRRVRSFGNIFLGKPQLKATLTQMRRNRADLTKGADALVFGASIAIRGAALCAALSRLDGTTPNGAIRPGCS